MPRDLAEKAAPVWCRHLNADALGLMFLDRDACSLTPLVYVPAAGTLCWENSCDSGTTAAGAFLAGQTGLPFSISLRQPGGSLTVTRGGAVTSRMEFAPGGSYDFQYHTPYGIFDFRAETKCLAISREGNVLEVDLSYDLFSGDQLVSHNEIHWKSLPL